MILSKKRLAVGISDEGDILRVVKISRAENEIKVLATKIYRLRKGLDVADFSENDSVTNYDDRNAIDITNLEGDGDIDFQEEVSPEGGSIDDDNATFIEILGMAKETNNRLALSVSEPKIFYNTFDSDWGLSGKKLFNKIIAELTNLKEDTLGISRSSLGILKITENRLMTLARDHDLEFFTRLDLVKKFIGRRLPRVDFSESAEFSLINLVLDQYQLDEDETTLILFVGDDASRLIFLQGTRIHHISQLISEGINSPSVVTVLYSRILLALDTLGLPKVDRIIITGLDDTEEIKESFLDNFTYGIKEYFQDSFGTDINIEMFKHHFDCTELDPEQRKTLNSFSVALGAAIRAVKPEKKEFINVDLNPIFVRDRQKTIIITKFGWVLICLIPIIIAYTILQIGDFTREIKALEKEASSKQLYLARQRNVEILIEEAHAKLVNYDNSITILDSLLIKTETWSDFIGRLMKICDRINGVWITELSGTEDHQALMKGYAYYRNRVPKLVKLLGNSTLKKVDVREIRESTVFYFEIETDISEVQDGK